MGTGWALAVALGIVVPVSLAGCEALKAAAPAIAPVLLQGLDDLLQHELDAARAAKDAAREQALLDAQKALAECRAARDAAIEAERRAVEAKVLAEKAAAEAAARDEIDKAERAAAAQEELRKKLASLRITARLWQPKADAGADAVAGDAAGE